MSENVVCLFRRLHIFIWADPDGGQRVRTPLKNHKNIGFLSNNGPEPLRNQAIIQC